MANGIEIKNINQGGIADSDYSGNSQSVASMLGLDIHSKPGLIKVNQALTKNNTVVIDDFVKCGVPCSDGNWYFFGSTAGKIWKRFNTGTWALEATAAPSAGSPGITGALEFDGYIYYAMQNKLGRWQVGTAWATRNDNFATFQNGDIEFHPMRKLNLVLYIGDANLVAQVDDASVFSANALDLETGLRIKALGQLGTNLLEGTFVNYNINETQNFLWNTWSVSFTNNDPIPEVGINSYLATDNMVLVSAGTKGNLYIFNGSNLEVYKQIKGEWSETNKAHVHPNATFNFNGLALFGLSQLSGTPCPMGVYSVGRSNRNYPFVLNHEYAISTGNTDNIEIGCIVSGGDFFFVSWKDMNGTTSYGVDILDLTKKHPNAHFTTRISMYDRMKTTEYGTVDIGYKVLPTDTSITIEAIKNGVLADPTSTTTTKDDIRNVVYTEENIGEASTLQIKVSLNANNNDAPEIESTFINLASGQ
jgi:hypothetical protein